MCRTIKILISNWPRTRKFSQLLQAGKTVAFDFARHDHALVTLFVQFLCCDWSKFDSWVHGQNLCSSLKTYSDFLKVRGGGADTPGPSPRSATDFVPTQKQKTEQNLGPILGFSKNKLRFFTGTNSDFRRRQTPFPKIKPPFSKTNSDFPKKTPLIFDKNKFRFSKKQTPIFKKTNSNFR